MDTICKGDWIKIGNKTIKLQLPILEHGYIWDLFKPEQIRHGNLNSPTQANTNYEGSYRTFEECKEHAIRSLKHYLNVIENYKEEDAINENIGRPNF